MKAILIIIMSMVYLNAGDEIFSRFTTYLTEKVDNNISQLIEVDGKDIKNDYLYLKNKDIEKLNHTCFFKNGYWNIETVYIICEGEMFSFINRSPYNVIHDYKLTTDKFRELYLYIVVENLGKTFALLFFALSLLLFFIFQRGKILIYGIFLSFILGGLLGGASVLKGNLISDWQEREYQQFFIDIENQTGEKVFRAYDFNSIFYFQSRI